MRSEPTEPEDAMRVGLTLAGSLRNAEGAQIAAFLGAPVVGHEISIVFAPGAIDPKRADPRKHGLEHALPRRACRHTSRARFRCGARGSARLFLTRHGLCAAGASAEWPEPRRTTAHSTHMRS